MKIAEIKPGMIVAVMDDDTNYGVLPRQAEVLEIVTKKEERWVGRGFSSARREISKRWVKVKLLDGSLATRGDTYRTYRRGVELGKKGVKLDVKPTQVIAPWETMRGDVEHKIKAKQAHADLGKAMTDRVIALVGKSPIDRGVARIKTNDRHGRTEGIVVEAELVIGGKALDTLLALAEKGAAS